MTIDEDILKELKKISWIMSLSNGPTIEKALEQYASNDDRKKIWCLLDGSRQSDEIAKILGKTKRAIDIFLKILEETSLVERPYNKPPTRRLDFVPASWSELIPTVLEEQVDKEESEVDKNG